MYAINIYHLILFLNGNANCNMFNIDPTSLFYHLSPLYSLTVSPSQQYLCQGRHRLLPYRQSRVQTSTVYG